jgi:RHS repeat-associated protein
LDGVGNRTQIVETLAQVPQPGPGTPPTALPVGHSETPTTAPSTLPAGHALTPTTAPSALPNRPGPSTAPISQTLVYGYDRLYRLTSASGGPTGSTTYSYDPVGNRLTRTRGATTSYSYDRADRITAAGAISYTVNANGNLTARGADTFTYDQPSRLTSATVSGTSASYAYDGDGKRISSTVGTTTTSYLYDTNRSLPVLLEDGAHRYLWGLGLAYEIEGGQALVYHTDGLHSVRALTNSNKTVVQTYETDEFGVSISGGGTQPFGYTGERRDLEAGLLDLRAREYDPNTGRLFQRDTLLGKKDHPSTTNRFSYVENNPVNRRDPSGMKSRSLSSCGLQSFGGDWGDCSVTVNTTGPIWTVIVNCARRRPVGRPEEEDCPQDCLAACSAEAEKCMDEWEETENPGVNPRVPWDPSLCQHGYYQCRSTGGCFLNPGWRQGGKGAPKLPDWQKVWPGRRRSCDP